MQIGIWSEYREKRVWHHFEDRFDNFESNENNIYDHHGSALQIERSQETKNEISKERIERHEKPTKNFTYALNVLAWNDSVLLIWRVKGTRSRARYICLLSNKSDFEKMERSWWIYQTREKYKIIPICKLKSPRKKMQQSFVILTYSKLSDKSPNWNVKLDSGN